MDRRDPFPKGRYRKKKIVGALVMLVVAVLVLLLPPIYLAGPVQAATGWPVFWARLCTCALWAAVMYGVWLLLLIPVRRHKKKKMFAVGRVHSMFDDALDALDSIAQGDYDVFIESDERFRHNELGEKINHLARQLSSMEQMRQDFVSNVSHEIRSPLTSIAGFAELLRKDDLAEEDRQHYIDVILSEVERMSKLSDSLLRLSMLDCEATQLNPLPFRMDKQVESVLLAQEPQWAGKGLELDVNLEEVLCTGDEELLLQVWQNLIQNAIKFSQPGGHIRVSLRLEAGMVVGAVEDDGIGIPPEDLLHIFERFYKVDKARDRQMGGNGLGLPLCKRIAELHGGQVKVDSIPGNGTTFTLVLPCAPTE